jgi:hypothetical protein
MEATTRELPAGCGCGGAHAGMTVDDLAFLFSFLFFLFFFFPQVKDESMDGC